jgi:hypothetical protein
MSARPARPRALPSLGVSLALLGASAPAWAAPVDPLESAPPPVSSAPVSRAAPASDPALSCIAPPPASASPVETPPKAPAPELPALPAASAAPQPSPAPPLTADLNDPPLYGYKDGLFFVRDRRDYLRLHPHAHLALDLHGFLGHGVDTLRESTAGVDLATRFLVRRARLGLSGEVFERIVFDVGVDLAARPAIDGAVVGGPSRKIALDDAWVDLNVGRGVQIIGGVFQAPFSMENRTAVGDLAMMERNLAIRGFVIPGGKAMGVALGGATQHELMHWDFGFFGAESVSPGEFQRHFDAIGRFYARPLADKRRSVLRDLQLGFSLRAGSRLPRDVTDDAPAINTGQGFSLFRPTHLDRLGRTIHVIPSGDQYAGGVELRIPSGGWDFRSEAYYVSRGTRESLDGHQDSNTERLGLIRGVGWYAELSIWPLHALLGSTLPDLGTFPHAEHLEVARAIPQPERYGLQIALLTAGVNASYDAAARGGDTRTSSGTPGVEARAIQVYQAGLALNYWHSRHFRLSANGDVYYAPRSGSANNLAVVPGNLGDAADSSAHLLWELGGRTTLRF